MLTTNVPTYAQLVAAGLDPTWIKHPHNFEFWQCDNLCNPNPKYQPRSESFIRQVEEQSITAGWTTPKPITDSDWDDIKLPWYPGVYRLHRWYNNLPLPVETKSGKDDERGIIYVGRHMTWLKVRLPSLQQTHLTGEFCGHYPLSAANQARYPKDELAISWLGCFSGPVTAAVEALLIRQYDPIHNQKRPMRRKLAWWIKNTEIEDDVAAEYLADIKWMELHLAWRRLLGEIK